MIKNILAIVAGLAAAFAVVSLVQRVSHILNPLPSGLDVNDTEQLGAYIASAPLSALLFVLASYYLGTIIGIKVANWIAPTGTVRNGLVIGVLMLAATIANVIMIPHPLWFSVAAVGGIVLLAWAATMHSKRAG